MCLTGACGWGIFWIGVCRWIGLCWIGASGWIGACGWGIFELGGNVEHGGLGIGIWCGKEIEVERGVEIKGEFKRGFCGEDAGLDTWVEILGEGRKEGFWCKVETGVETGVEIGAGTGTGIGDGIRATVSWFWGIIAGQFGSAWGRVGFWFAIEAREGGGKEGGGKEDIGILGSAFLEKSGCWIDESVGVEVFSLSYNEEKKRYGGLGRVSIWCGETTEEGGEEGSGIVGRTFPLAIRGIPAGASSEISWIVFHIDQIAIFITSFSEIINSCAIILNLEAVFDNQYRIVSRIQ